MVARRAQIRSSTAVVAADLLEVNRGDAVEILESLDVQDPSDNTRKERWLRVRMNDAENTEGWIEARNVMPEEVLEASRKLAGEDKGIAAQATGQLRASSNLRLSPDRSGNENIMMRLDTGSSFEIVGWKRIEAQVLRSDRKRRGSQGGSAQPVQAVERVVVRRRMSLKKRMSFGTKLGCHLRFPRHPLAGFMANKLSWRCLATLFSTARVESSLLGKDLTVVPAKDL